MTTHYLAADIDFTCTDPNQDTDEIFDVFTDAVADAVYSLDNIDPLIIDPDIAAVITNRSISILMGIEADSPDDAVKLFAVNVRSVLHKAGCRTAGWPTFKPTTETPPVRKTEFVGA